ncbi:MAG: hypothetical protein HYT10_03020 [Candidatus Levybacteria bacterium]|nr:hypothetical protein [Candidatus Levybacteria bacterium]
MDNNTPIQPSPTAPKTPPPIVAQDNGKGRLFTLIGLLIGSAVLLAGYFMISSKPSEPPVKTALEKPMATVTPSPTPLPTSTDPNDLEKEAQNLNLGNVESDFSSVDKELTSE